MREWLKNTLLFGGSSLVALAGIEVGLRTIGDDLALGNQYAFYRFDPKLGWTNTPGETGMYRRLEFSYPVANNALGMRDDEIEAKKDGEKRIAVLGDSFTWGVGAATGERFTEVMEKVDPALNVLNFGVSGYGTVQQSLQLDLALAQQPDAVVVALCLGNDVLDNVYPFRYGYHKPTAKLGPDGKPEVAGYPLYEVKSFGSALSGGLANFRIVGLIQQYLRRQEEKAWMKKNGGGANYTLRDAQLYLPDSALTEAERGQRERALDVTAALLGEMRDKVTSALGEGRFVVMLVPTKFEAGIAEQILDGAEADRVGDDLKSRLDALGVTVTDGRTVITPRDFWPRDGHWSPAGHDKIGRMLVNELETRL